MRAPVDCVVARGVSAAALGPAVDRLGVPMAGRAVVLTRLSQPTPATADVVHEVVDLLLEGGCHDVVVGTSLQAFDRDRGHRSVDALARQAGLGGRTGRGRSYRVVDLLDERVAAPVSPASVLHGHDVSADWVGAEVRVVVGRGLTDLLEGYAGCLATLLGAGSEVPGAEPADLAVELATHLPPRLAVIDVIQACAGADGARLPEPVDTRSLVVARDALLADCTLATLLGEDRSASRLVHACLRRLGSPSGRVEGSLTPFAGIQRPHPLLRAAARSATADPRVARVLSAAVGGPDDGAQPVDPVLASLRSVVTPLVGAAGDDGGHTALTALLELVALASGSAQAWSTGLAKDQVERREVSLGFDPAEWPDDEYDSLPTFFEPFDALVRGLPENVDGLRWCLVDGATVFETGRDIAADFDQFVLRVDVAAGISLMADYVGGRRVPVPGNTPTGVSRQAERNLYLPQPNYLAVWGGEPIDVCKIELVERTPDWHRLTWRTINSPNGSATYDDGSLTFTRTRRGTRATVRGRQLFALPPGWAGADLTVVPEVRNPLLEEAYRRFFTTTFDNLEACFEGREFRIGRPPGSPADPLLTESLDLLRGVALDWLHDRSTAGDATGAVPAPEVDSHGFRHVRGPR